MFSGSLQASTFLDDTFLKDCYKDTLLTATAYDGDNKLFTLAFCVSDIKDDGNWDWFLMGLRQMLYEEVPEPYAPPKQLMFISNSDTRIGKSVERYYLNMLHSCCVLLLMDSYEKGCKNLGFNLKNSLELAQ